MKEWLLFFSFIFSSFLLSSFLFSTQVLFCQIIFKFKYPFIRLQNDRKPELPWTNSSGSCSNELLQIQSLSVNYLVRIWGSLGGIYIFFITGRLLRISLIWSQSSVFSQLLHPCFTTSFVHILFCFLLHFSGCSVGRQVLLGNYGSTSLQSLVLVGLNTTCLCHSTT